MTGPTLPAVTYSAEFAGGIHATLTIGPTGVAVGWDPALPQLRGRRARAFLQTYREWRDTSLADYARRTGQTIGVIET